MKLTKQIICGETICSLCEKSIQLNYPKIDCFVCKNKHLMPKDGLLKNRLASEILYSNRASKSFNDSLKNLLDEKG